MWIYKQRKISNLSSFSVNTYFLKYFEKKKKSLLIIFLFIFNQYIYFDEIVTENNRNMKKN